jgi:nicotinamidase-related amidase
MNAIPSFYLPQNAAKWGYSPNLRNVFSEAETLRKQKQLKAASTDKRKLHLLLIDVQKDFCFPWDEKSQTGGTLYVGGRSGTGAIDDSKRIAEFIYRNLSSISAITPTMDTHFPYQIFSPSFWLDEKGNHLLPHDMVTGGMRVLRLGKDVGSAIVNPGVAGFLAKGNYDWLTKQVAFYCKKLEDGGKYMLYIWPEHCVLGSDGHALVGVVQEARMFHAYARNVQSEVEVKGGNPLTENYSVLGPEVVERFDGKPLAQKNHRFIKTLLASDAVVIGGQASSHCVKSSIDDLLSEILATDPVLAKKVYILSDCTSAVTVPNGQGGFIVDFTDEAEKALARYDAAGMHVVKSTDPISGWPDINA